MKIFAPSRNSTPPPIERPLIMMCADSPFVRRTEPLEGGSSASYVRGMLGAIARGRLSAAGDLYTRMLRYLAHPKPYGEAIASAQQVLAELLPDTHPEYVVVGRDEKRIAKVVDELPLPAVGTVTWREWSSLAARLAEDHDGVVLMYPDPLGLGFRRFERALLKVSSTPVLVVNGRGRSFLLDSGVHRQLLLRRALERTYALGFVLDLSFFVVTPVLAALFGIRKAHSLVIQGGRSRGD